MNAQERHARFNPGPPSNPRRVNVYGHWRRGAAAKRHRIDTLHAAALEENAHTYTTGTGQVLQRVHARTDSCLTGCVIHAPSAHRMTAYPTHWREDRGIMERICPHGVGHPDPDGRYGDAVHGCDGCCL